MPGYRFPTGVVVQLEEVDMIPADTPKTRFDRPHDVRAAEAHVVVADSRAQPNLGHDQHARFVEPEFSQRLTGDRFIPWRIP